MLHPTGKPPCPELRYDKKSNYFTCSVVLNQMLTRTSKIIKNLGIGEGCGMGKEDITLIFNIDGTRKIIRNNKKITNKILI